MLSISGHLLAKCLRRFLEVQKISGGSFWAPARHIASKSAVEVHVLDFWAQLALTMNSSGPSSPNIYDRIPSVSSVKRAVSLSTDTFSTPRSSRMITCAARSVEVFAYFFHQNNFASKIYGNLAAKDVLFFCDCSMGNFLKCVPSEMAPRKNFMETCSKSVFLTSCVHWHL